MLVKELPLPEKALVVLSEEAEKLNPPQEAAVKAGLLDGKNLVIAAPTASGKTLIAEMAFLRHFLSGGKSVYLVPLKALGSEKYDEFKSRYGKIGMRVAISVGDMDSEDVWLKNYDLIIASNGKMGSRRSAEAEAEKIAAKIPVASPELEKIANDIERALPSPTKQCRRLATIVRKGSAFHHAGLVAKQRKLIEDNFRAGKINFITATTSLAFGLNLPASRVIVRDTKRYIKYGMDFIPNIEISQMFGRAGRPRYDKEGEAILLAKSEAEKSAMEERYINGETENIYSKLSVEPVLRMHVLALVTSNFATSKGQLRNFFSKTFFAHQYGDIEDVMSKIEKVLRIRKDFGFIKFSGEAATLGDFMPAFELNTDPALEATALGRRVAELYIDPLSANHLIKNVRKKSALEYLMTMN